MTGVLSSLWMVPAGVLAAGRPFAAVPVAVAVSQAFTWRWAALDLAVFVSSACARRAV